MTLLEFLFIIVITLLLVITAYMSYCCEIAKRQVKYSNNYTKQMCKENRELKEHVLILEQKIDLTESNLKKLEDKILMNDSRVFIEKQKQDIRILDKQIKDAYKDMQYSITKYNEIRDEFIEKQKQDENIEFWYPNFKNKNK